MNVTFHYTMISFELNLPIFAESEYLNEDV